VFCAAARPGERRNHLSPCEACGVGNSPQLTPQPATAPYRIPAFILPQGEPCISVDEQNIRPIRNTACPPTPSIPRFPINGLARVRPAIRPAAGRFTVRCSR